MTQSILIGFTAILLLVSGCKSTPSKTVYSPDECLPEIQVVEKLIKIDPALTQTYENPVPQVGDNGILLEWCLTEAANNRKMSTQLNAIRNTQ